MRDPSLLDQSYMGAEFMNVGISTQPL
jgi:hypothetical protein